MSNSVREEISRFLAKPGKGTASTLINSTLNLKDDLCLDSLDIVELIAHLENKYGIEFDGDAMPSIETVEDLARYTFRLARTNREKP